MGNREHSTAQIIDLNRVREMRALVPEPSSTEVQVFEPDLFEEVQRWAAAEFAAEYPEYAPTQDNRPPG